MTARRRILYLDFVPGEFVQETRLAGIRRYAAARGWEAVAVPEARSRPRFLPALLARHRPEACVVECSLGRRDLPPRLFGGVPVAYLGAGPGLYGEGAPRVEIDDAAIAAAALRELRSNRPSAAAFVDYYYRTPWADARERAFLALAAPRGNGPPPPMFRCVPRDRNGHLARQARLAKWLAALPRHAGVFAVNDQIAADVVAAARAAGLRVPYDLTVVGVDDKQQYSAADAQISTVRIDYERAGFVAARLAAEGGAAPPCGPLLCVRRASTRGFGRREPRIAEAMGMIRAEACLGLSAGALAARFPGSRWLFELRFREATGHSVLDEILHVRLERACTLLSQTDTALGAVPGRCGFRSGRALRQLFASRFGCSMREWRRRHRR